MTAAERREIDARFAVLDLRQELIDAMGEAITYRNCFVLALDLIFEQRQQLDATRERLRQVMGIDPAHAPDTTDDDARR